MAEIVLENVVKRFGNVTAVDHINLTIEDGEFMVLLGPSGCGKTTTLRLIAGLEDLTEGHIYIDGKVVDHLPPKDRDIAMVFQNYALYPHMKVYDNIAFGLRLRRIPKAEIDRRVKEAAKMLKIDHLLDRKPGQLSGGQRQRVALARAIVRQPKAYLMDEPLSNLDAKLRVETRAELLELHRKLGVTTVYVTHDQVEAMTLGTRVTVLRDGKIQQVGTPLEIYSVPKNVFVAGFVGSPPMNFLKGRLEEHNGNLFFVAEGDISISIPDDIAKLLREKGTSSDVILGIRPEDTYIKDEFKDPFDPGWVIKATVKVVERLGAETYAHMEAGPFKIVAHVSPLRFIQPEDTFDIVFDMRKSHFFDANTEERIGGGLDLRPEVFTKR
jgi:multiple sugar transport system ATP-binding protein